jgi:glucose-1-phosphate cytidylyltransferase
MKVVLFCGGMGLRMREASERIPKPMIPVGNRPLLLHLMKYYAHFGHTEFILCLGYNAHIIKEYFLNYREALANDFILSEGGRRVELLRSDIQDWRITFIDSGLRANVGQRLLSVRDHIGKDEVFLANYADALTDLPLPLMLERHVASNKIASFLCVRPGSTFHVVSCEDEKLAIKTVVEANLWINGGFFAFRKDIFDYIRPGEELVEEPFKRIIEKDQLLAYRYEGFWMPMDTLKEQQQLEALYMVGEPPWAVWEHPAQAPHRIASAS